MSEEACALQPTVAVLRGRGRLDLKLAARAHRVRNAVTTGVDVAVAAAVAWGREGGVLVKGVHAHLPAGLQHKYMSAFSE